MPQTEAQRAWYLKNREKILAKAKENYEHKGRPKPTYKSTKEYQAVQKKIYRQENKERLQEYYQKVSKTDRYKKLRRARENKRRAAKLKRTVSWANLDVIKEIYLNCPEGYHVDHIVPLQGINVSGLHVENNLQYLPASENISKSNKWENSHE